MRQITLRQATPQDAALLVPLIHHVMRVSNTPDYGADNVARVIEHFTPDSVAAMIERCFTLIALQEGQAIGTASIGPTSHDDTPALRTFFVDPDQQRSGIGCKLLAALVERAKTQGLTEIPVRSSIAGEPFYAAHGFTTLRDHWDGDERTIQMVKHLA